MTSTWFGQRAGIQVFQHREGVRPHGRQERIGRPVEDLQRRGVCPEVAVADQLLDGLGVGHEGTRLSLVPQSVRVPDAVGAVQRAALDVIQAQPALAVFDDIAGADGQAVYLVSAEERYGGGHLVLPGLAVWKAGPAPGARSVEPDRRSPAQVLPMPRRPSCHDCRTGLASVCDNSLTLRV
jgi:hypothetical protein